MTPTPRALPCSECSLMLDGVERFIAAGQPAVLVADLLLTLGRAPFVDTSDGVLCAAHAKEERQC